MAQPAQSLRPILYKTPAAVAKRLRKLGLSLKLVQEVLDAWVRAAAGATPFEPKNAPGLKGWIAANGKLRESCALSGCRKMDPNGAPLSVNEDLMIAYSVTSGDRFTGLEIGLRQPATKNTKGAVTVNAVIRNAQLAFATNEDGALTLPPGTGGVEKPLKGEELRKQCLVWFVLVFADLKSGEYRCEVSLPSGVKNGKVTSWLERILVPKLDQFAPGNEGNQHDEDDDRIDVPVRMR